jgi:hypothetical protein
MKTTNELQKKLKRMKNAHEKRLNDPLEADFYIASGKASVIFKEIQMLEQILNIQEN